MTVEIVQDDIILDSGSITDVLNSLFSIISLEQKIIDPITIGANAQNIRHRKPPFLDAFRIFLCEPPRSAVDKPSAARYNTFQRPSTGANLQLLHRIFSLSQCAAFVKGDPLYGRFGSYYADHRGGTFS